MADSEPSGREGRVHEIAVVVNEPNMRGWFARDFDRVLHIHDKKMKLVIRDDPGWLIDNLKRRTKEVRDVSTVLYEFDVAPPKLRQGTFDILDMVEVVQRVNPTIRQVVTGIYVQPDLVYDLSFRQMFPEAEKQPFGKPYAVDDVRRVIEWGKRVGSESGISEHTAKKAVEWVEWMVEYEVDSFRRAISYGVEEEYHRPFFKAILNDSTPKLHLLVAPPGYGKSTLIDELRYLGVRRVPKVTTRPYRTPEEKKNWDIESIPSKGFTDMERAGEMLLSYERDGNRYGLTKSWLWEMARVQRQHICDVSNFEAAYQARLEHPDEVRLVALFPQLLDYAGFGLEQRMQEVGKPSEGFSSFVEELEHLKRSENTEQETRQRLGRIIREARAFQEKLPYCDIVLDGHDTRANVNKLIEEMDR